MSAIVTVRPMGLRLDALSAAEVMVANPISLRATASCEEAMTLFAEKAIDAAPVIDDGGRPIGVISRSDVFIHLVENLRRPNPVAPAVSVEDLMTPAVFSVEPSAPLHRVVEDLIGMNIHRVFVVDNSGVLVGVITAMDVLKRLRW